MGKKNSQKTQKLLDSASHRSRDSGQFLTNSNIAELLATQSRDCTDATSEEAAHLIQEDRSWTEFSGVGLYLEKLIRGWIQNPPALPEPSEIREGFFHCLKPRPFWQPVLRGQGL
jgi:hypothetical protein